MSTCATRVPSRLSLISSALLAVAALVAAIRPAFGQLEASAVRPGAPNQTPA